jgi:hypothetical protein
VGYPDHQAVRVILEHPATLDRSDPAVMVQAAIPGFEAAGAFFGGVFRLVIVDNMAPVVDRPGAPAGVSARCDHVGWDHAAHSLRSIGHLDSGDHDL